MSTQQAHVYVEDPGISISRGLPLAEEGGLGELTLPGFLREVTSRFAQREALVQWHAGDAAERWSYAQLWQRSVEVANALIACGLGKGECVGVLMTNRAEFLSSVFGTALAGGVAAPLSTFSTPDELEFLLSASACSVLLLERQVLKKDFLAMLTELEPAIGASKTDEFESKKFPFLRHLAVLDSAGAKGVFYEWPEFIALGEGVDAALVEQRADQLSPSDPGVLFFSSGSTARPKGILSAHRGVSIQLWRMGPQQGLPDGVRSWSANGFFWSGNFSMTVGGTLAMGGSIVLQSTFQPEQALAMMADEQVNFLFAWPHQWEQLLAAPNWPDVDLSALSHIDKDSPVAKHPTIDSTWVEPRHCYGNTETFTLSTAYPAGTSAESAGGSHGLPLAGNIIKIVEPLTGITVPLGERGEIAVKGPTLMLGYLGVPLGDTLDEQGFFRTGDGGYLDRAGRLFWEGRLNDIIKTGGANVSPVEIDEAIRTLSGVKVVQTVGIPDDFLGELVVSCIVPHAGAAIDEEGVRAHARKKLASYKVPRRVLFFTEDELQLTGSAKIKTSELKPLVQARLAQE